MAPKLRYFTTVMPVLNKCCILIFHSSPQQLKNFTTTERATGQLGLANPIGRPLGVDPEEPTIGAEFSRRR